jgi:hypothetical protein
VRFPLGVLLLALAGPGSVARAAGPLTADEAAAHVGDTATVCGLVASTNYATRTRGQPTYLDFDRPYPDQRFTVVIWGSDRAKFGAPEMSFRGKRICATGTIRSYRGRPEIIATDPRQLTSQ